MNQELDQHLTKQFPQIFVINRGTNHENRPDQLTWGFECDDGWYQLIHDLCQSIMVHCETTGDPVPVAEQVKEKFGELRFYVDHASEGVYKIISQFEDYSYKVCETCGKPGRRRLDLGWISVLCDYHYDERKKR